MDRLPMPVVEHQTRVRVLDGTGELYAILWLDRHASDEYISSFIPDGCRAVVDRDVWPLDPDL